MFGGIMTTTKKRIGLNEHFDCKKMLRFALPSVIMMIFTSVYSIVDGVFVSNFVGDTAFTGLNLIFPVIMILGAVGMMFGSGGSAILSRLLGEGKKELANRYFSLFLIAIGGRCRPVRRFGICVYGCVWRIGSEGRTPLPRQSRRRPCTDGP